MIVWGVWWSVKLVLQTGMLKSLFCVRPWSWLTISNFSERGPTDNGILMSLLVLVAETKNSVLKLYLAWFSASNLIYILVVNITKVGSFFDTGQWFWSITWPSLPRSLAMLETRKVAFYSLIRAITQLCHFVLRKIC